MRAVVQRVASASVTVEGQLIARVARGLVVLVGIGRDDTDADVAALANKVLSLRVFPDPGDAAKMWKASVKDVGGDVLCVSQFTLMAQTKKGSKPDFHNAMAAEDSRGVYAAFVETMRRAYTPEKVQDGAFGAMMDVSLTNEGPVTFTLDTRKFEYVPVGEAASRDTQK